MHTKYKRYYQGTHNSTWQVIIIIYYIEVPCVCHDNIALLNPDYTNPRVHCQERVLRARAFG